MTATMLTSPAHHSLHFTPLVPEAFVAVLAGSFFVLLVLGLWRSRPGIVWRAACGALFLALLSGPSLVEEQRQPARDVAALIIDQSASQKMGKREAQTEKARQDVLSRLNRFENLDVRVARAPLDTNTGGRDLETRLFDTLDTLISDVPHTRRAGAILITDGQIHDVPAAAGRLDDYGPVHALISGSKKEQDRRIVIVQAPAYGMTGQSVTVKYKIEETQTSGGGQGQGFFNKAQPAIPLTLTRNGQEAEILHVPVGREQTLDLVIEHSGQNFFELSVPAAEQEITPLNNRVSLLVNGVRDRLKVLLVSGQPHAGGRTWRNLLTSDPGVDLVHFTILREPDKQDHTPQNELSLIAFPFRELFEIKLYDFDLIIFDRYKLNQILPTYYFANIVRYVREGGALLVSSGPSYAGNSSIYHTALSEILPTRPTGQTFRQPFRPALTALGERHPVTMDLARRSAQGWGPWLRQVGISDISGDVVMNGQDDLPLLVLARVERGRIAQLASDQIWLWGRGYDGGGPYTELLRRLAHWLMKEPSLDENALEVQAQGSAIRIRRRQMETDEASLRARAPDGTIKDITLTRQQKSGWLEAELDADMPGLWTFEDGTQTRFAMIGDMQSREFADVRATEDRLSPLTARTKGHLRWLEGSDTPKIRLVPAGRKYFGADWIGLRQNGAYTVSSVHDKALLPAWAALMLLSGLLVWAWWREGKAPGT